MSASDSPITAAYTDPGIRNGAARRRSTGEAGLNSSKRMAADGFAVLLALCLASIFRFDLSPMMWVHGREWLLPGKHLPMHAGYLAFFALTLLLINRKDGLYLPPKLQSAMHEQRETIRACLGAGLLLCGGLYVLRDTTVSRGFLAYFIGLTTVFLCGLRMFSRWSLYRRYQRGIDTRNLLIVGTSHMGQLVRKQTMAKGHFGRVFKGFVEVDGDRCPADTEKFVLGDLTQTAAIARQLFIDEIIITERCGTPQVIELVKLGRELDVEVLVVPGFYDELTPDAPIEYLGTLPVVALHRRNGRFLGHLLKRFCDSVLSPLLLIGVDTHLPAHPDSDQVGFSGSGVLRLTPHREKGPGLFLLQIPNHGYQRRSAEAIAGVAERKGWHPLQDHERPSPYQRGAHLEKV